MKHERIQVKAAQFDGEQVRVASCGHVVDIHRSEVSLGYAVDRDTLETACYACAGTRDREALERGEKIVLYFTDSFPHSFHLNVSTNWSTGRVTNWPGSWSTVARVKYTNARGWKRKISALIRFSIPLPNGEHRFFWGRIGNIDNNQSFLAIPYKNIGGDRK